MKDVLVLVATGFEDTELISTLNVFKRNAISYDLVSIENKDVVKGQNEALVATRPLAQTRTSAYQALFLPGGQGHKLMLTNPEVTSVVQAYQDKYIFAICAAPAVLLQAQVITGPFTSYPGVASDPRNTGKAIEVTGSMITGRDYMATMAFAHAIVNKLK